MLKPCFGENFGHCFHNENLYKKLSSSSAFDPEDLTSCKISGKIQ